MADPKSHAELLVKWTPTPIPPSSPSGPFLDPMKTPASQEIIIESAYRPGNNFRAGYIKKLLGVLDNSFAFNLNENSDYWIKVETHNYLRQVIAVSEYFAGSINEPQPGDLPQNPEGNPGEEEVQPATGFSVSDPVWREGRATTTTPTE